jgi:shikimate dehydrogenase
MNIYGLVGYPLSHAWSADYFSDRFKNSDNIYRLFPLPDLREFPSLIKTNPDLCGLNVTIPYKEKIIPFLDDIDREAHEIGAVNTIRITREKNRPELIGYNTDAEGFRRSSGFEGFTHALILGTGGAAKAVAYALKRSGISVLFASRDPEKPDTISYSSITGDLISKYRLIINATPLGMYPGSGTFPDIPYPFLSDENFLYDLVYNPEETVFLKKGKNSGAKTMNGLAMLKIQAELSYRIWETGKI